MNKNIVATHKHTFTMHILRNCVIENLKLNLKLKFTSSAEKQCDDRNPFYEEIENMFSKCVCVVNHH